MRDKIHNYFKQNTDAILADLARLMAFRSTADRPEEISGALDFMMDRAKALGLRTGVIQMGDAGWAETGEGTETLAVLVHVDVVGEGDAGKWDSDPFALTRRGDFLYGRGVIDDKGPAVVSLYALAALYALGVRPNKRVRLIVGTSEELQWTDMAHYIAECGEPDAGFTPDGGFPVYNMEKGYADLTLNFREAGLSEIGELFSGDAPNTVPSLAVFRKKGGEPLRFTGRAAHSSAPKDGENAIAALARALRGEYRFADFIAAYLDGDHGGAKLGLDALGDGVPAGAGGTVVAPTMLRLEGGAVSLNVNVRIRFGTAMPDIEAAFREKSGEYGFTAATAAFTPPHYVPRDTPAVRLMNAVYEEFGLEGGFLTEGGATYAAATRNCVCWGPGFPGEEDTAHAENERWKLTSLLKAAEIYTLFLARYAGEAGEKDGSQGNTGRTDRSGRAFEDVHGPDTHPVVSGHSQSGDGGGGIYPIGL